VRDRLVRLAEAQGGHEELAGALEDELEGRDERDPAVPALLALLAPLEAGPLGRPRAAAAAWERLFALAGDAAILDSLEALYRREGQLAELVTIYRRRLRLASDPAAKRELYTGMANLMERLGDKDGAIDALRQVLALDEGDENALASLTDLLGDTGRWPELADLLGRQIEVARSRGLEAEARELTYKLGRVRQVRLADPAGALERFREVLAAEPRHGRTLAALEELAASSDAVAKALAAEVLAPIYEAERDWARYVQALEALAAVAAPGAARAAPLRRIAEVYAGPLASPEMALVAAGRALRETPDDAAVLAQAVAAADAGGLGDELCELLLAAAEVAGTDEGRLSLLREAARRLDAAGEAASARDAWKRIRILAADDEEALVALARLHRVAGDGDAYLEVQRTRLLRAEDPHLRRELLLAIADAQEAGGDAAGALSTCRRVLELAELDRDALERMDRLCTGAERWADLALVLERLLRAAGDADRIPLLLRLAGLKEARLLDRDGALALYREVLDAVPGQQEVVARLEALLARDPAGREAAELLEAAYLSTGAWAKYATALDARASGTVDPEARKGILVALAEVRERRQERPDLAFIALARAFRDDPADPEVRSALERLARETSSQEELAALYEEELPRIRAGAVAADVALSLGALAELREGPEPARRWYERARELDPEVGARALPALDRIHRAAERWPELADVLEARAALEEDAHERVSVLFRLAALAEERLGERDRAAAAYERIVELDRRHLPALRALDRLYEEAGRFDRLHEVLLAERDAAGDPAAKDRLAVRLAEVAARGLKDPEKAIGYLEELLARSPRHEAALKALEGLYEETSRWKDLAALLARRLESTVEPREIARLHEKLGWVQATKLASGDEALRSYLAVLERDPRNRRALEAVRELQRERGELEALAGTLRRLVPLQDDARGVKAARLELARTLSALGRREEAIDNARRTLDVEPHDDALLAGAEELLLSLAAFSDAVRAMEFRAARLASAERTDEAASL
jgi:tetratricopeptide (TPR) repeat protein